MRLVHFAQYEGPYGGSFLAMLRAILAAAKRRGDDVEVVLSHTAATKPWLSELEADGVPIRFARGTRLELTRLVSDVLAERPPDEPTILHTHFTGFDIPVALAARGRQRTKVFWHLHTEARTTLRYRLQNLAKFAFLGRSVAGIFCVGPHMAERVAHLAPRGRARYFRNALDVAAFTPPVVAEQAAARVALGVPAGVPVLLHFGWNWDVKGGDLFLEVLQQLRSIDPVIVGIARTNDPTASDAIAAHGLEGAVVVVSEVDRVQTLFAASDVLVASSRSETMNFTAFEALCCGVPVAASDIAGHAAAGELPGCVLCPRDPVAMAAMVRRLLDAPAEELADETTRARATVAQTLSLDRWTHDLLDAYDRALAP